MAYDGNPADHVKPDVTPSWATVRGLHNWIAAQDLATEYNFCNAGSCLITAWHVAHGEHKISASRYSSGIYLWSEQEHDTVWSDIAQGWPRTYQGALDRCRALLAEGQQ